MSFRVFFDEASWVDAAVHEVFLDAGKRFSLVLSGGSTPAPVYRALAEWERDWRQTTIYLADERFVPAIDKESNARLVRETLPVPAAFELWNTEARTPRAAAEEYDAVLRQRPGSFDVVVLGIGPDGHFASLFPHSPALHESDHLALATQTEEFAVRERLTMTPPAPLSANKIVVLLKRANKLPIVKELETGNKPVDEFPARMLLQHSDLHVLFANL